MEAATETGPFRPGKTAGGPPVELWRILTDPVGVGKQVSENVGNPNFWASQLPEAGISTLPFWFGSFVGRMAASAQGTTAALKAAQAAGNTAKALQLAKKIRRMQKIGGYGMGMAMEAAGAERSVREWEASTGEKLDWLTKNFVQIGTGVAAGSLEAFSLERIFRGKKGMTLVRKLLDSIVTEGSTEGAQEFVANAFRKVGYDPDQALTEGVVESILVGAALGGLFGAGEVSHEHIQRYRQHIKDLNKNAKAEQEARPAEYTPPEVEPFERYSIIPGAAYGPRMTAEAPAPPLPPAYTPGAPAEAVPGYEYTGALPQERPPAVTTPAPEGGTPLVDQFGRPVYPSALDIALTKKPWERNALDKWLVDQNAKAPTVAPPEEPGVALGVIKPPSGYTGPRGEPVPMGTSASTTDDILEGQKSAYAPEGATLRQQMVELTHLVSETGDPQALADLTRLMVNNPMEAHDLFRIPEEPEVAQVRPIAQELEFLMRQVDETGDPAMAKRLHELMAQNLERISGAQLRSMVTREHIERAAPLPIGTGTQVQLADGSMVFLEEDKAAYDVKPVRIRDEGGNVREVPLSEIVGVVDREGNLTDVTDTIRRQITEHTRTLPPMERPGAGVAPDYTVQWPEPPVKGPRKPREFDLAKAEERNDLATFIRAEGLIDSDSYIFKQLEPEEKKWFQNRRLVKKGGRAPDDLLVSLKESYPHIFGQFDTDADLLAGVMAAKPGGTLDDLIREYSEQEEEQYPRMTQQEFLDYLYPEGGTEEEIAYAKKEHEKIVKEYLKFGMVPDIVLEQYPHLREPEATTEAALEKVRKLFPKMKLFPKITEAKAKVLASDPTLIDRYLAGDPDAIARVKRHVQTQDLGTQETLPGVGGGLFDTEVEPKPLDYFDITRTGMPLYDELLKNPDYYKEKKGMAGTIIYMSPDSYIREAGKNREKPLTYDEELQGVDQNLVVKYMSRAISGEKMPMLVLDTVKKEQEGRHRAMVAKALGLKEVAVLKVLPSKKPEAEAKPKEINTLDLAKQFQPLIAETQNLREIGTQREIKYQDLEKIVRDNYDIENLEPVRKQIEEAFELGIVLQARHLARSYKDVEKGLKAMEALYNTQPVLKSRTSTTIRQQAYSTPVPLAYLMSRWAGVTEDSWVYDSTAGNGMLLIDANPENTAANEIDPIRAKHLKDQGIYSVTQEDASELVGKPNGPAPKSMDIVLENPPFGKLDAPTQVEGYAIRKKEHLIAIDALKAMDDEGRAAIILGGHSFMTPYGAPMKDLSETDRIFFNYLYSNYNVTHHINIDGKVYERMGTKWPIRLITIDGRKAEKEGVAPYEISQIEVAKSFNDVYSILKGELHEGIVATRLPEGEPAGPGRPGRPGAVPTGQEGAEPGGIPGELGVEGGPAPPGEGEGATGGRPPRPGGAGAPGPGTARPGGRKPPTRPGQPPRPEGRPGETPPVSPPSEPGEQGRPPGGVSPRPSPAPPTGTPGTAEPPVSGPAPKPVNLTSGNTLTLPDGTIVTIEEEKAPYEIKPGEPTVRVRDADGNIREIPISQLVGAKDQSGTEITSADQVRIFNKGQTVETTEGLVGEITKIRGIGDRMQLTVKAADQTVTVSPAEIANILPGPPEAAPGPEPPPDDITLPPDTQTPAHAPDTNLQVFYQPVSKGNPMMTMAPRYMAEATRNYVLKLEERVGPVDEFVRSELGYDTLEELYKALGAEQIEGVAMAIDAHSFQGEWKEFEIEGVKVWEFRGPSSVQRVTQDGKEFVVSYLSVTGEFIKSDFAFDSLERAQNHVREAVRLEQAIFDRVSTGFIIGHQTGVGKGRMVAAMIDWARSKGMTPVFLTADGKLFSDMITRDFKGVNREVNPFIIASDVNRASIYNPSGDIVRKLNPQEVRRIIRQGSLPAEYDAVFSTYSQFMAREMTAKKQFLLDIQNAFFILDESHKGSGDSNIGHLLVDDILPNASGVVFSSATFAKRPDTMLLYLSRLATDLHIDTDQLIANIRRGGVPLQEWVAHQFALSGQMVRNELSFTKSNEWEVVNDKGERTAGPFTVREEADAFAEKHGGTVTNAKIDMPLEMDTENKERDQERSDDLTECLRGILRFSQEFVRYVRDVLRPQFIRDGISVHGRGFRGQLKATSFASVMHNAIAQMQYCLRVETTVKEALAVLERGEKVVIGVYNTMESFMKYMEENGEVVLGEPVEMTFADVLRKSLNGSLKYKKRDQHGQETIVWVRPESLPPNLQAIYQEVLDTINDLVTDVPALPIDMIIRDIEANGYTIGEITGRDYKLAWETPEMEAGARVEVTKLPYYAQYREGYFPNPTGSITEILPNGDIEIELDARFVYTRRDDKSAEPRIWKTMTVKADAVKIVPRGILEKRSAKEKNDKNTPVNKFNTGGFDALIVNSAASTGLSLHASQEEAVTDKRVRNMLLTQLAYNIDDVVQLLGRIHRTGQVADPKYKILVSTLPSEKRPLVLFQKKLASLFANITAKGEAAYSLNLPDVVNSIGDQVIAGMFAENPDLNTQLGGVLDSVVATPGFISASHERRIELILAQYPEAGELTKKVSGYVAVQTVVSQEEFWAGLDARYNEEVERLKQLGEYNLETEMVDLEAETLDKIILTQGGEGRNELSSATTFEIVRSKVQRKPLKKAEIEERIDRALDVENNPDKDRYALSKELNEGIIAQIEEDFDKWIIRQAGIMSRTNTPEVVERFRNRAENAKNLTLDHLNAIRVGSHVQIITAAEALEGVIYDIRYKKQEGSNPGTPSNVRLMIAVQSTMRTYQTSMAGAAALRPAPGRRGTGAYGMGFPFGIPEDWDDKIPAENYETRYLVTGNLLGNTIDAGRIVHFSRQDGSTHMGFLMPLNFDPSRYSELQSVLLSQSQTNHYLSNVAQGMLMGYESSTNTVGIRNTETNKWEIDVGESKRGGGKFYLDDDVLANVVNNEFYSARGRMRASIEGKEALRNIVDILYRKLNVAFSLNRNAYDDIFGGRPPSPFRIAEGPKPYRVKTTLGQRQIVPNPEVLKADQADEARRAYGSESTAQKLVQEAAVKARSAVRNQLSRQPGAEGTLAHYRYKISQEYQDRGWVSFEGRRLTKNMESYEIAEMFQIYRSPQQENFHVIYTDEKGTILRHNMLSSGTLSSINVDVQWLTDRIHNDAKRLGAAKVHFLHNHPSGDPTMSVGDKRAFQLLREGDASIGVRGLGDLVGEFVVIDHGRLSYMRNNMQFQGIFRAESGAGDWMDKRLKIKNNWDITKLAARVSYDKNKAVLIFTDQKNNVNGWTTVDKRILQKPVAGVRASLMKLAKAYNCVQVSIVLSDIDVLEEFIGNQAKAMAEKKGNFEDWVLDIQTADGVSIRGEFPVLWKEQEAAKTFPYAKGFVAEDPFEDYMRQTLRRRMLESVPAEQAQEYIDVYKQSFIAEPEEEKRTILQRTKDFAHKLYDETIDRWGSWERRADRAIKEGAIIPMGEMMPNTLSYQRGVEGRIRQGIIGDYVYHDKMAFDEELQLNVFEGDELVRRGPSLKRRLEALVALAKRMGMKNKEVRNDLEVFMVAERDLELAGETGVREPGTIKGTHILESNNVIKAIQAKYGEEFAALKEVAESFREWGDEMILQPLLQVGFIDMNTYLKIKQQNMKYIPYKRLLDDINNYVASNAAVLGVPGRVIKEIRGSERKVLNPLEMWLDLAARAHYAYAKNKVIRSAFVTALAAGWDDIKEVRAKYYPVNFNQKQAIDKKLRPEMEKLAADLGINVTVVASLGRGILGQFQVGRFGQQAFNQFREWLREETTRTGLTTEEAKDILLRFATFESTLAHELGHGIDHVYGLQGLLINSQPERIKKQIRAVADQRLGDAPSASYRKYVRKKSEQVAEFVSRYIIDRASVERLAPDALKLFENYLKTEEKLKPLLNFRLSHQSGMMDFLNTIWVRDPRPPEPLTLPYFRDGKQRWLKLPPDMFQATINAMPGEMGILMRIASFPAKTLRAGAILVPEFAVARNPVRDVVQSWLFSRFGFSFTGWVRDAVGLMSGDKNVEEWHRQWEAGGGPLATLAQSFVEPDKISMESVMGDPSKTRYFFHPVDALRYGSAYLENLTRFSIYRQAREKGLSHAEAIFEARRTTLDYARAGGHPTIRFLNMIIPFFNASLQGMDKLITELRGPNRKAVMRRLGMLGGISILIWLYASQDDRYKELENWEKNYFWHLPLTPNAPMLRIPKPFEAGILFGSTFERMAEWASGEDIEGVRSALHAAYEAATPEVIPTIARPYVEGLSNWDFFRMRPIEDESLKRLPVQLRAKPWTSELAKAMGKKFGISPVKIEHFVRAWSGGLGANYALVGIDAALKQAGVLEDIPQPTQDLLHRIWGVRSFFTRPPTGYRAKSVNSFFANYQEVMQADAGWKALWKSNQMEQLDKFLAERPEAIYARVARKYMASLSDIKKQRTEIHLDKKMTGEEKREKLEALDNKIVTIARQANSFMSPDIAEKVGMPPRLGMTPKQYYTKVAAGTAEAWQIALRNPQYLDDPDRLAGLIKSSIAGYKPKKKKGKGLFPRLSLGFERLEFK